MFHCTSIVLGNLLYYQHNLIAVYIHDWKQALGFYIYTNTTCANTWIYFYVIIVRQLLYLPSILASLIYDKYIHWYTNHDYTRPGTQNGSAPLQVPPVQLLEILPCSTKTPSQVKLQESPTLASPSSPSEHDTCPFSGALSDSHVPTYKVAGYV